MIPDVAVEAPAALFRAQELIFEARITSAPDSGARRAAEFALNAARAATREVEVPASALADYAGEFAEYAFTVRGNRLHAANRNRNGRSDKLVPVTPTLFYIDWESEVEFLRDETGAVSKIRVLWNDGWVDTIERTKP